MNDVIASHPMRDHDPNHVLQLDHLYFVVFYLQEPIQNQKFLQFCQAANFF
jgi:hypothetical protein